MQCIDAAAQQEIQARVRCVRGIKKLSLSGEFKQNECGDRKMARTDLKAKRSWCKNSMKCVVVTPPRTR